MICSLRTCSFNELCSRLDATERIVVLSCDSCGRQSDGLGGATGMRSLADKLEKRGFVVTARVLCNAACNKGEVDAKLSADTTRQALAASTALLPLACANSHAAIRAACGLPLLEVVRSVGAGDWSKQTGALLRWPHEETGLEVDENRGMTLAEAARRLGLQAGPF